MGCNLWRCLQPFAELQRRGFAAEWGWNQDIRTAHVAPRFQVVIMARLSWTPGQRRLSEQWVQRQHEYGHVFISEWDDDVFDEQILQRARELGQMEGKTDDEIMGEVEMRRHVLQIADGVTVSTQTLASTVRRYTDKPVIVVPNSIDLDWWAMMLRQTGPRVAPSPSIGWAGGARPDRDVEAMAVAWGRIARSRPDVTFVVIGHQPKIITDQVPEHRIVRLQWLPIELYPINYVNIDIGCCPLASESFNRSKSAIKAMEYSAADAAVVASPTVYKQIVTHGETGYLAETADEWETALLALLDSPNRRHRLAQNLRRLVEREHSLAVNWWRWPSAWIEVVEDYQERQRARSPILIAR